MYYEHRRLPGCECAPATVIAMTPQVTQTPHQPLSQRDYTLGWTGRPAFAFHPLAPQGATVEVKLPVGEADDPAMTWSINLRKKGLVWTPGGHVEGTAVTVVPGGTYTIVLDDVGTP